MGLWRGTDRLFGEAVDSGFGRGGFVGRRERKGESGTTEGGGCDCTTAEPQRREGEYEEW